MKRGLITWDMSEIPPAVFEQRLKSIRDFMPGQSLPAIVVYSELWRSNHARFLSNYMPYFNRALLVIPSDEPVTLLCGLSPRVYGWIRSVTTIEDVRPAGNFARTLSDLAKERGWSKIGVLDFDGLPYDLHQSIASAPIEIASLQTVATLFCDDTELYMRRKAATMAREILESEMSTAVGSTDYEFVGRLERQFRRAGAEDLIILVTHDGAPAPAIGKSLAPNFSVSLALEYRGHWVRLSRPHGTECSPEWLMQDDPSAIYEDLGGSYPYECIKRTELRNGSIFAVHIERRVGTNRLFYGDTCWFGPSGPEIL